MSVFKDFVIEKKIDFEIGCDFHIAYATRSFIVKKHLESNFWLLLQFQLTFPVHPHHLHQKILLAMLCRIVVAKQCAYAMEQHSELTACEIDPY